MEASVKLGVENMSRMSARAAEAVRLVVRLHADLMREMIRASMKEPKTGRWYGMHQASAPGEAPAIKSGALYDSIRIKISNRGMSAEIGTNLPYGDYLERGTAHMLARPFLNPAIEQSAKMFVSDVELVIARLFMLK